MKIMLDGLLKVLEELEIRKVIIGKQGENSEQFSNFYKIIKEKQIPVVVVKKGDVINIEKGVRISILFPENKLIEDNILNNNSLVLQFEYKDFKMLFTGDIEILAEEQLTKMYINGELESDILKVPHHRFKDFEYIKVFRRN